MAAHDSAGEFSVEPLRREQIPLLARWHQAQWSSLNPGETLEGRIARLEQHTADGHLPLTWVAVTNGAVLGSASLVPTDLETRPDLEPWLASVYVAQPHRRRGIGGRLVRHVVQEGGRLGFPRIYLFTPDRVEFYRNLGWQVRERISYRRLSVTLMTFELPGSV